MVNHVAEQSDGKLIVVGSAIEPAAQEDDGWSSAGPLICRLSEAGNLDTAFGTGGCRNLVTIADAPGLAGVRSLVLQADDRIVLHGSPVPNPDDPRSFALVRLMPDGKDDTSFGNQACGNPDPRCALIVSPQAFLDDFPSSGLAIAPNGRILVTAHHKTEQQPYAVSFTKSGDLAFAKLLDFGPAIGDPAVTDQAIELLALADGSLIFVNELFSHAPGLFGAYLGLAKLHFNGTLDETFGDKGYGIYNFVGGEIVNSIGDAILQDDGHLLVAGSSLADDASDYRCGVLRVISTSGNRDMRFGNQGVAMIESLNTGHCVTAAIMRNELGIALAGRMHEEGEAFLLRIDQYGLFLDGFDQ